MTGHPCRLPDRPAERGQGVCDPESGHQQGPQRAAALGLQTLTGVLRGSGMGTGGSQARGAPTRRRGWAAQGPWSALWGRSALARVRLHSCGLSQAPAGKAICLFFLIKQMSGHGEEMKAAKQGSWSFSCMARRTRWFDCSVCVFGVHTRRGGTCWYPPAGYRGTGLLEMC